MATIAVVFHSGFGHTKALAEHVAKGAASVAGVTAKVISVDELPPADKDRKLGGRWAEVNSADGIIFGSPTYMGSVSAKFKEFMENSSGIWFTQGWRDKIAAGFTNSGGLSGDKLQSLTTMAVFAGQHSMIWVTQGVVPSAMTAGDDRNLNRLGAWLGAMAQSDNAGPDVTPPQADRLTHEVFGKRVAEVTLRWLGAK